LHAQRYLILLCDTFVLVAVISSSNHLFHAVLQEMKPLRPFPFPLNIGTDICQISRIYGILKSPRGMRFVNRILSPEEQARKDPRLRCLEDSPINKPFQNDKLNSFEKNNGGTLISEEIARRDPDIWTAAAFVAGR
jgi:holo-[acyl-carrier protein] synthase